MKIVRPLKITDAILTSSSVPETDFAVWSSGTTYAVDAKVILASAGTHRIYQSLQASNLNHSPASSPAWWADVGPTNKWAMFDGLVGTQTTAAGSLSVTLNLTGRNNTLALLNVTGADTIQATMVVGGVTVFDRTASMVARKGVTDWYSWFFEPRQYLSDLVLTDLPPYLNASITVTLTGAGEVACGALIVGQFRDLGLTQYSPVLGIQDYSVKTRDPWGNFAVQERAFSKTANFPVEVLGPMVDQLYTLLASYRATPVLWIGAERFGSTCIFGFYKDFSITIAYANISTCSLEIEGLT